MILINHAKKQWIRAFIVIDVSPHINSLIKADLISFVRWPLDQQLPQIQEAWHNL